MLQMPPLFYFESVGAYSLVITRIRSLRTTNLAPAVSRPVSPVFVLSSGIQLCGHQETRPWNFLFERVNGSTIALRAAGSRLGVSSYLAVPWHFLLAVASIPQINFGCKAVRTFMVHGWDLLLQAGAQNRFDECAHAVEYDIHFFRELALFSQYLELFSPVRWWRQQRR